MAATKLKRALIGIVAVLVVLLWAICASAQQDKLNVATVEQIKAEFNLVPCKNEDRLQAVKALFERLGASAPDITLDRHSSVQNLIVRKQGASSELIVIGAHYDKVPDGCGAIDNW